MTGGGPGPLDETWEGWTTRVTADLAELTDTDWLTFSLHVPAQASGADAAQRAPRGWRRASRPSQQARVPDVFVQARRLEGALALELIGDTEFEGLTDLTSEQQAALSDLGWRRDAHAPEFDRTVPASDGSEAAALLRASLADVLGAGSPADVDIRRAPRP